MQSVYSSGKKLRSPGGSFLYTVQGPCCMLYDREELPWPSCSLQWRGKQPSWNRIGPRFVADISTCRFPSYSVKGYDNWGHEWEQTLTLYQERMSTSLKKAWYSKVPKGHPYPEFAYD